MLVNQGFLFAPKIDVSQDITKDWVGLIMKSSLERKNENQNNQNQILYKKWYVSNTELRKVVLRSYWNIIGPGFVIFSLH